MDDVSKGQQWNPDLYDDKHAFVWKFGAELIGLLSPKSGERILDLGSGTGHLTARIAASGAEVIGIDSDPGMVEQARRSYPDLRFEVADARDVYFPEPFDAVFSNAMLHWITEPEKAVCCIAQALKAKGRFVAEFGGKGNVQTLLTAIGAELRAVGCAIEPRWNPWYFPSIGEYAALLEAHRLQTVQAILFDRPTSLEDGEAGLRNWLATFANGLLKIIPADRHPQLVKRIEDRLRPMMYRDGVWQIDYKRIRVVAVKEE